jgi:hypothetical protein
VHLTADGHADRAPAAVTPATAEEAS